MLVRYLSSLARDLNSLARDPQAASSEQRSASSKQPIGAFKWLCVELCVVSSLCLCGSLERSLCVTVRSCVQLRWWLALLPCVGFALCADLCVKAQFPVSYQQEAAAFASRLRAFELRALRNLMQECANFSLFRVDCGLGTMSIRKFSRSNWIFNRISMHQSAMSGELGVRLSCDHQKVDRCLCGENQGIEETSETHERRRNI